MKWQILVSAPYLQPHIAQFRSIFEANSAEIILPEVHERLSEEELLGLMGEIDGVVAGDDRFTRKVLEKATPRLKVISKWGTGIDSFDQEACQDLGVVIRNTPDAFTDPVADSVMGYILAFARRLPWMNQQMKAGVWDKIPGRALNESTLGVIGVGKIGKAIVRRARSFDMRVFGHDLVEMPESFIKETGIEMVSRERLLSEADFITVNCDLNATSLHLIGEEEFKAMKPSAVIVNLARGPIIEESAMISALQSKEIAGAALDVYEDEPLPLESPFLKMDNVLLAPHNSNSSPKAWARVHINTLKNLFEVLEGQ
ncbi:MAG: phosphoglycerate dehydrogenase [Desulfuromonadales bacterium]|nr:phosphoglycerate dehydrogenase [Desulfuromonadales bacterium]